MKDFNELDDIVPVLLLTYLQHPNYLLVLAVRPPR